MSVSDQYDQIRGYIASEIKEMKEETIFSALLRKYKWKTNYDFENVLLVLALHKLKLPINAPFISKIKKTAATNANRILHILGDRKILTLTRNDKQLHSYSVSPLFLRDIGWMSKSIDITADEIQKGIWGSG